MEAKRYFLYLSNMKVIKNIMGLFLAFMLNSFSFSQTFHFDDTITYFVKDVDTSSIPLHWYLEIFNDLGQDTTLRWKADLSTIPSGWTISFDDQSNYYPNVSHNDSADFTLLTGLTFPQKLIIGNSLNGNTGTGSAIFKIYDPNVPEVYQYIEYKFIISEGGKTDIDETSVIDQIIIKNDHIHFPEILINQEFRLVALDGKVINEGVIDESKIILPDLISGNYILILYHNEKAITKKFHVTN